MAISHQQFIQLLAEKLGRTTEEISEELDQLIEEIKTGTAKGDEFIIEKFGTFKIKNGRLSFEVDSTFALEINYKYAGMTPVELKGGKTATVSDDEITQPGEETPDEEEPDLEPEKKEEVSEEKALENEPKETEEEGVEPVAEIRTEPEPDWVAGEVPGGDEENDSEKSQKESDQQKAHIYRSPNRLLNDDEVPKRRTGLFVVIVLVLAIISAGYYFVVNRGGAPVVDKNQNLISNDTVYVHDDNTKPAIRNTERNASEDTAVTMQSGVASDSTQLASNTTDTGSGTAEMTKNEKKSIPAHTASVNATVAKKDSVNAQNIMHDLSETSLYGLHGKDSDEIGDYYTIVIASLRDQSKAREVGKRWKSRDYRVVIAPGQVHEQTWYRVGLGQFSTIPKAQEAVKELPDQLQDNQHHFIRRIHQ